VVISESNHLSAETIRDRNRGLWGKEGLCLLLLSLILKLTYVHYSVQQI